MAHNGSEYLLVALRRETRFGFVKALTNKRSETVKEAMVDMQLLLRGAWRFHGDEGREFMGAADSWLREHTVLHTTTGAYDPNANSLIEERCWFSETWNSMSPASSKRTCEPVARCCGTPKRNLQHHSKRPVPGQNDTEPIVLERRAFSGHVECDLLPREKKSSWPPWGCLAFCNKNWSIPLCVEEVWSPWPCKEMFVGWNRSVPHGINIATFRDDGEVEEVFTNTTVRTRDTVFPLFSGAGMKPATETELQEFGESVRVRPDEVEEPSLALRRPAVANEETEGNAHGEEMQDDRGREHPDPDELRRRAQEASAGAAGSKTHDDGRRGIRQRGNKAPNHSEKISASSGQTRRTRERSAAMTPTAMNRQRDVSESLAQLCSCVPLLP